MILFLGYIIKIYIYCSECIDFNKDFAQESCNENESNYQEPSLSLFDSPISENEQKECLGFFDALNMSITNDISKTIHHNEDTFISNDDLSDFLRFLDNITWESSDEKKFSNINNMRPEKFKEYLKQTYDNINYYINSNLPKNNASNYIKRLDKIIETINIVNPSEITYDEIFTIETDNYFKYILNDLKIKYMNNELNDENLFYFLLI
ncbi:hypothetical protein NBO_365g0002 [Nosema bombycis CQ1]|uniref:Uncharacterized protein n=1 Tax=Nosema bombycis (strain CQ1 / CVCC 102059) TaxID=578461 RepID=R0KRF6_NOSB1|nr:hypothetical protein NBO_365g0002 [Nosema bombycis CQ1]|eukprot:EOB12792.1 hypothetical protein NBO_365g0002 [Nosema bombycis CQ1]